jgi:hypothetical protein
MHKRHIERHLRKFVKLAARDDEAAATYIDWNLGHLTIDEVLPVALALTHEAEAKRRASYLALMAW